MKFANRPGKALVLGDVGNVERLHGVFDVLGVHVVNLTDVAVPEETQTPSQPIMQNEMKLLVLG